MPGTVFWMIELLLGLQAFVPISVRVVLERTLKFSHITTKSVKKKKEKKIRKYRSDIILGDIIERQKKK